MQKLVDTQNPERNRDPLTRVTGEEQRNNKHLMAEEEAKDALAIERDGMHVTNGSIRSGVIWA